MRFFKVMAALLAILAVTLMGCGGGGGGGSTPAPGVASDTIAPTVSITAPANSAKVSGMTTVSASASDNVGVTQVEFYLNGVLKGTTGSAPYTFNWDTASLSRGSYSWSAKAYDAAGNVGQSANVVVTVPITVAMATAINGSSAVGTVSLAGLGTPEVFGLDLVVSLPSGASVASATQTGGAANALAPSIHADGVTISLASSSGFGSGEVMRINFAGVPAGAQPGDFGVSLSDVFDASGGLIQ